MGYEKWSYKSYDVDAISRLFDRPQGFQGFSEQIE
jgi:hypothetical protein